ncbi:MAG: hypothetical protein P3W91_005165 [Fervidobacterium sp.]|nr:hypothetical protein [Fervidobacterium sp.]
MVRKVLVSVLVLLAVGLLGYYSYLNATNEWIVLPWDDIMSGERTWSAFSPDTWPLYPLKYPYDDMYANLVYTVIKKTEFVALVFSSYPLLEFHSLGNGYFVAFGRAKFDNQQPINITLLVTKLPAKVAFIVERDVFVENMKKYNKVLIEVPWLDRNVYFEFSLKRASTAISEVRSKSGMVK